MKRIMYLWCAFALFAFVGCSDEDHTRPNPPHNLDASLLPGYWIMVKDGVKQEYGYWFSDEKLSDSPRDAKTVWYFHLTNGMNAPAKCVEKASWYITEEGVIIINHYGYEMPIMRLTKDKMTIRVYVSDWDENFERRIEYERLADPIEIEE